MTATIKEVACIHVRASGPVSFNSVLAYCKAQQTESKVCDDCDVAMALTALIREGLIALYDDGLSFTSNVGDSSEFSKLISGCQFRTPRHLDGDTFVKLSQPVVRPDGAECHAINLANGIAYPFQPSDKVVIL